MRNKEHWLWFSLDAASVFLLYSLLRAKFSGTLRDNVRMEQRFQCAACGLQTHQIEVHHRVPQSMNGNDTRENAVGLCPDCHEYWNKQALLYKIIWPGIPLAEVTEPLMRGQSIPSRRYQRDVRPQPNRRS